MAAPEWRNVYRLSDEQLGQLEQAEQCMEMIDINRAESILMSMLEEDADCVPVLNNLGHMHGRYLSDFEKAVEY